MWVYFWLFRCKNRVFHLPEWAEWKQEIKNMSRRGKGMSQRGARDILRMMLVFLPPPTFSFLITEQQIKRKRMRKTGGEWKSLIVWQPVTSYTLRFQRLKYWLQIRDALGNQVMSEWKSQLKAANEVNQRDDSLQ